MPPPRLAWYRRVIQAMHSGWGRPPAICGSGGIEFAPSYVMQVRRPTSEYGASCSDMQRNAT